MRKPNSPALILGFQECSKHSETRTTTNLAGNSLASRSVECGAALPEN